MYSKSLNRKIGKARVAQINRVNGTGGGSYGDELYERGVLTRPEDKRARIAIQNAQNAEFLTADESAQLHDCEAVIERGLKTFYEVGEALLTIRDNRLYRLDYSTFEEYCRERWQMSKTHANRLIGAAGVIANLAPMGVKSEGDLSTIVDKTDGNFVSNWTQNALPSSERVARAIAHLTPPQQVHVWQVASERTDGKVTAAIAAQVAEELYPTSIKSKMTNGIGSAAKEAAKAVVTSRQEARESKLAEALATASPAVVEIVGRGGVDDPDTVQILKRLEKEGRESFTEVQQSGYIQPGEAEKAVHISEGALKVQQALYAKSDVHRSMAMDNRKNGGVPPALQASDNNEWYTPSVYVDAARELMGAIDVDPASCEFANRTVKAAQYFTIDDDGLTKPWMGRVWLNPPYGRGDGESNQSAWTKRLLQQYREGCTTEAVLLVNAVTDRGWFQPLWQFPICFVSQRIRFYNTETPAGQPTHGSVLVYLGDNKERFVDIFSQFGPVVTHVVGQKAV